MSSIRFHGVRFVAYTMDHKPRHVHGFYADVEAIADLRQDGEVSLANRTDAVRPSNGSKSDVPCTHCSCAQFRPTGSSMGEES